MIKLLKAALYTAILLGASLAQAGDMASVEAMREGDMKKLQFHSAPKPVSTESFVDLDGNEASLADYQGKIVVLNFWATWCAPCRHEMPMLSNLQSMLSSEGVEVVTIATGRNPPQGIVRFFEEIQVDNLPTFVDPKQTLAREMAVLGLPVTVIIDAQGQEVARLTGDAEWDSENAVAILRALRGQSS